MQSIQEKKKKNQKVARELVNEGRVNFMTCADYSSGSDMEAIVTAVFEKIAANVKLEQLEKQNS